MTARRGRRRSPAGRCRRASPRSDADPLRRRRPRRRRLPRRSAPGGLFVALAGEQADGARLRRRRRRRRRRRGARQRPRRTCPAVVVEDTAARRCGRLARAVLDRLPGPAVVGITGSSGKTSTKDLLGARSRRGSARPSRPPGSLQQRARRPADRAAGRRRPPGTSWSRWAPAASATSATCAAIAPPRVGVVLNVGQRPRRRVRRPARRSPQAKGELVEALPARRASRCSTPTTRWCARWPARTAARVVLVGDVAASRRARRGRRAGRRRPRLVHRCARRPGAGRRRSRCGCTASTRSATRWPRRGRARARACRWRTSAPAWRGARRRSRWRMEVTERRRRRHRRQRRLQRQPRVDARRAQARWPRWGRGAPDLGGARRDAASSARTSAAEHDARRPARGRCAVASTSSSSSRTRPPRSPTAPPPPAGTGAPGRGVRTSPTPTPRSPCSRAELRRRRRGPGQGLPRRRAYGCSATDWRARPGGAAREGRPHRCRCVSLVCLPVRHPAVHPLPASSAATASSSATTGRTSHHTKRGTPTMGGAVIICRHRRGYVVAHLVDPAGPPSVSRPAGAVPHDRAGPGRLPRRLHQDLQAAQPRPALGPEARRPGRSSRCVFAVLALQFPNDAVPHARPPRRSPSSGTPRRLRLRRPGGRHRALRHLGLPDHRGDLERGEPHRRPRRPGHRRLRDGLRAPTSSSASGSPTRTASGTRATQVLRGPRPARPRRRRRRRAGRLLRLPVVERLAGEDLHGRHRLARARRRARRAGDPHPHRAAARHARRPVRDHHALGDHPGRLVQDSPANGCSGWRRCSTTSSWSGGRRSPSSSGSGSSPGSSWRSGSACSTPSGWSGS